MSENKFNKVVLWWVTDQLPYPPRNGVTLPSFTYAKNLKAYVEVRLVILVDIKYPLEDLDFKENEKIFGKIIRINFEKRTLLRRVFEELIGIEMFQHSYGISGAKTIFPLSKNDRLLVTPISAVAKLRNIKLAEEKNIKLALALVNDCTAGEYYFRSQNRAGNWRHKLKARLDRWRSKLIGRIEAELLAPYRYVLLQTKRDAEIFQQLTGTDSEGRHRVLPNGINPSLFSTKQKGRKYVIFMAELSGEYGPIAKWLVSEVWLRMRIDNGFDLLVVGKGASPALKRVFAEAKGVRHIEFVSNIETVYEYAAIAISPVFKGFGLINKTLDAMAAGVPVLGGLAAFNGIIGFEPGVHGIICERADTNAFANALNTLIRNTSLCVRVGQAGHDLLAKGQFDWNLSTERLAKYLGLVTELNASNDMEEKNIA